MVAHTSNPGTWEVDTGGGPLSTQGLLALHTELQANRDCLIPCP